jgi:putative glutamine amidotransferase
MDSSLPDRRRREILAQMSGLFLTGGADIDPSLYGEETDGSEDADRARDELELSAWRAAEERNLPVLGVCRGLQAINVFAGGSLIQDLPDHGGTPYGDGAAQTHNMVIDPDSRLGRAIAQAAPEGLAATDEDDASIELTVNTFHHQAVSQSRLAPGLRAVGWAGSSQGRIVEAAESRDGRWIVGVQCHPERTESTPSEFEGLFEAFVRAARETAEPVI